jgi:hypothetical protein
MISANGIRVFVSSASARTSTFPALSAGPGSSALSAQIGLTAIIGHLSTTRRAFLLAFSALSAQIGLATILRNPATARRALLLALASGSRIRCEDRAGIFVFVLGRFLEFQRVLLRDSLRSSCSVVIVPRAMVVGTLHSSSGAHLLHT